MNWKSKICLFNICFFCYLLQIKLFTWFMRCWKFFVIWSYTPNITSIFFDCSITWEFARWCYVMDCHFEPFTLILKNKTKTLLDYVQQYRLLRFQSNRIIGGSHVYLHYLAMAACNHTRAKDCQHSRFSDRCCAIYNKA